MPGRNSFSIPASLRSKLHPCPPFISQNIPLVTVSRVALLTLCLGSRPSLPTGFSHQWYLQKHAEVWTIFYQKILHPKSPSRYASFLSPPSQPYLPKHCLDLLVFTSSPCACHYHQLLVPLHIHLCCLHVHSSTTDLTCA